jgi:hypothetical protein
MATIHRVQDIRVWHLAKRLVREVYTFSDRLTFRGDSVLRNQMRRGCVHYLEHR